MQKGRPKFEDRSQVREVKSVRLPRYLIAAVEARAKASDETFSAITESALIDALAKNEI